MGRDDVDAVLEALGNVQDPAAEDGEVRDFKYPSRIYLSALAKGLLVLGGVPLFRCASRAPQGGIF